MSEKNREYSTTIPLDEARDWLLQLIDPDHNMEWTRMADMVVPRTNDGTLRLNFSERPKDA